MEKRVNTPTSDHHWLFQSQMVCRPALPMDRNGILEMTRDIWNGHDYVPYVLDEWYAEKEGMLSVALLGGKVIGLSKLSYCGVGQWWLEGLRVHPEFQGRGLASRIFDYTLSQCKRLGGGVVRLFTHQHRWAVHHMCEERGFQKIGRAIYMIADPIFAQVDHFSPIIEEDLGEVLARTRQHPLVSPELNLVDLMWRLGEPQEEIFTIPIQKAQALWWRNNLGFVIYLLDWIDEHTRYPLISYLQCPKERLTDLLYDFRVYAGRKGYNRVGWNLFLDFDLENFAQKAGFKFEDEEDIVYLYELRNWR
ncbi:MAG TPA: GNAT family N-acetyltransferase [Anaerolineaceae bacterium]